MAQTVITIRIMPDSPDVNLEAIEKKARSEIEKLNGYVGKVEIVPVAFGLNSINITFILDESKGTEIVEERIKSIEDVQNAEVIDVRRAVG